LDDSPFQATPSILSARPREGLHSEPSGTLARGGGRLTLSMCTMLTTETICNTATIAAIATSRQFGTMPFRLAEILVQQRTNAYRLAKQLEGKVSRASVYRMASGDKVKLSPEEVAAVCEALDVTPNDLFGWTKRGR
jgi:DNA-binding Xre family transcriptional regulator